MAYYTLTFIKANIEIQDSDTSIDSLLATFGGEGDAWVDSVMGNSTALSPVPDIIARASSNYAAGRYLARIKEDQRGTKLLETAEKQLLDYIKGAGHVVVYG